MPGHAELSAPAKGRSAKSSVVAMNYFDEDEFGGRDEHEQLDSPADEHICGDSCFDWLSPEPDSRSKRET
jgi:hypothetical protein